MHSDGGREIMESEEFLKPRLVGERFEGHAIPLEFLRDLSALEGMIVEIAKWRFRQEHGRKRVTSGFTDGFSLALTDVEEGSAKPVIVMLLGGMLSLTNLRYFQDARGSIADAIQAAADGKPATDYIPAEAIAYFDRLGRNLHDGEAIEFPSTNGAAPARLTKDVRRKLLLSLPDIQEVTEEIALRGRIEITNQGERKFVIKLADGTEVPGSMAGDHYDKVIEATSGYRKGSKLFLQGTGVRDRQGKLVRIETIEYSDVLDPLDINARLDEMRVLKDGWLDGVGTAPDPKGLDWLEASAQEYFTDTLPKPRIYPAPEGTISLEWSIDTRSASLEIDLGEKSGYWHVTDLSTKQSTNETLNLADPEGWGNLAKLLTSIQEGQGE